MMDDAIIRKAFSEERILITNDKDFGEKVYRQHQPHSGIVLLRLDDERPAAAINALKRLFRACADQLSDSFAVVTETRVRLRRT